MFNITINKFVYQRLGNLGLLKKISIGLILIITVASILVYFNVWNPDIKPIALGLSEEAKIQKASFDSVNKAILLDVQSMDSKDLVFNVALIDDSEHKTVATIVPFQAELPAHENTTITINLNNIVLGSGNYTVNLRTAKTYNFYSPPFAVP
jgi:hypothetical protein